MAVKISGPFKMSIVPGKMPGIRPHVPAFPLVLRDFPAQNLNCRASSSQNRCSPSKTRRAKNSPDMKAAGASF